MSVFLSSFVFLGQMGHHCLVCSFFSFAHSEQVATGHCCCTTRAERTRSVGLNFACSVFHIRFILSGASLQCFMVEKSRKKCCYVKARFEQLSHLFIWTYHSVSVLLLRPLTLNVWTGFLIVKSGQKHGWGNKRFRRTRDISRAVCVSSPYKDSGSSPAARWESWFLKTARASDHTQCFQLALLDPGTACFNTACDIYRYTDCVSVCGA